MSRLQQLAVNEEGFIFDPGTGQAFTSNATGLKVIEYLKSGKEDVDIVKLLVEEYEITQQEADRDVSDFLEQLRKMKLL